MWTIYVIQNNFTLEKYIGITESMSKRMAAHNAGGRKFTTRKQGEWILIYAETYRSKPDALLREKRLKRHASGKVELFKRLKSSLLDTKTGEGCNKSTPGDCLSKTQLPANSQEDV